MDMLSVTLPKKVATAASTETIGLVSVTAALYDVIAASTVVIAVESETDVV